MSEIKPCPFCGADTHYEYLDRTRFYYIQCNNCNAMARGAATYEGAVNYWNMRHYDYDVPAIVKKVQRMEAALKIFADPESWNDKGYSFYTEFPFVKGDPIQLAKEALGESCKQPE